MKRHIRSFFGQKTGIIFDSDDQSSEYAYMTFIKKQSSGIWEKPSERQGKKIKLNLGELIMIRRVLAGLDEKWSTIHTFKEEKTQISVSRNNNNREQIWINVDSYSKNIKLPTFGYTMIVAEEQAYQDISVDIANEMIENKHNFPNLIILDVRTECEYDKGHLYDAFLLPQDELESRLSELEDYKQFDIIVYCKSGGRSQQASQILSQNGFTNIYNMQGGILAWLDVDYPIYTSSHYATVDKIQDDLIIQLDPLLKFSYTCCDNNQSDIEMPKINYTILVDEENYSETLITFEYNDSITESTIYSTRLYNYEEITDKRNRTVNFMFIQEITEDSSISYYTMNYLVQEIDYNLTISTTLVPNSSNIYNNSVTTMYYFPVNKSQISMEIVKFNFSTTLSEKYAILGKVVKEIGDVYKKSEDETLKLFVEGYKTMEKPSFLK